MASRSGSGKFRGRKSHASVMLNITTVAPILSPSVAIASGVAAQNATSLLEVTSELVGQPQAARLPAVVLHALDAAEVDSGASLRCTPGHPGAHQVLGIGGEMEPYILVEGVLEALPPGPGDEERTQAREHEACPERRLPVPDVLPQEIRRGNIGILAGEPLYRGGRRHTVAQELWPDRRIAQQSCPGSHACGETGKRTE